MNGYTYEIQKIEGYYSLIVLEKETHCFIFLSSIDRVKTPYNFSHVDDQVDKKKSVKRIKFWVKNNHPELII